MNPDLFRSIYSLGWRSIGELYINKPEYCIVLKMGVEQVKGFSVGDLRTNYEQGIYRVIILFLGSFKIGVLKGVLGSGKLA